MAGHIAYGYAETARPDLDGDQVGMSGYNLVMVLFRVCLMALLCLVAVRSQTREEAEKRLGQLPPDQRAYERFRFWLSLQAPEAQRGPDVLPRYSQYLKTQGFTESDIGGQLKFVEEGERRLEVERWNRILTAEKPVFNTNPNAFLVEMVKGRKPGTALDVGMGQGRNAIWLAQQGWDVTGFDPADKAVALAVENARKVGVRLKTEIKGREDFDFGERRWDLILLSYAGGREMPDVIQRALKPGGILVIEGAHRDATKSGNIGGAVVFDTGELPVLY